MKKVIVRINDNYSIDQACAAILKMYGYLSFVEQFRTFQIITFDCPAKFESNTLNQLRALNVVKNATWDNEVYAGDPMPTEATLAVDTDGSITSNTEGEGQATFNTRILTTTGSGTIYVKVQNISGSDYFVFSQTQGGTYSRFANYSGLMQGGTYTFDQSDSSNNGHPFRFSETPDGIHTTGGTGNLSAGVTVSGTPGTDGQTVLSVGQDTPSILYYYCSMHPGMGRYSTVPDRFGTVNIHDYWHLDRITKQDRQYLNRQFSQGTNADGNGVDIYIIDSGVRGASRPTGNNAALHPELYDPDFVTDLNGTAEQQNYRVNQLSHFSGTYGSNNEDDNGHGTYCAILSAGRTAGIARNAQIFALKAFNSQVSGSYSGILGAYQAVIDHNDSTDANYKGNNRPAVINASFGPTIPTQNSPNIELNDAGDDTGTDEEMLDDIEGTIASQKNIIIVRSAGNGFRNSSDVTAGPLQTKCVAGARTAGYSDNPNGGINNVDVDQNKITVGATSYNDRWAFFSNYGSGCTTVAPGEKVLTPLYDWTANTPYTSTSNYTSIDGTSFSSPIVAGIIAAWCGKNGYTLTTNNLCGLAKQFVRTTGSAGDIRTGTHGNYPINSIIDKKLIDNPFVTLSGSSFVEVKFNPADSSHFLGNLGKKVQLRTTGSTAGAGSATPTTFNFTTTAPSSSYYTLNGTDRNGSVSGNNAGVTVYVGDTINFNLSNVSSIHPFYIRVASQGANVTTPTASGQGSTGNATVSWTPAQAGTFYYQCSIHPGMIGTITVSSAPGGSGGIVVGGINLSTLSQSGWLNIAAESAVNNSITIQAPNNATAGTTGGGSNNYLALIKSEEKTHESYDGVVSTSTSLTSSTDTQEGLGQSSPVVYYPVDSGVDFNYNGTGAELTTSRGMFYPYIDTNVTWSTNGGVLSGSPYADGDTVNIDLGLSGTTFANEPTFEAYTLSGDSIGATGLTFDTSTGNLSGTVTSDYLDTTYTFLVTENVTGNARSYAFTTTGTGVLVTVTSQPSDGSIQAGSGGFVNFGPVAGISDDGSTILYQWEFSVNGGIGWATVTNGGGYSGATSSILQVDDDFAKNNYQFRCKLETSTTVAPAYTNAVTLTVFRIITVDTQPTNSQPIAPAAGSFTAVGSTLDSATIGYQWQKSENGDGNVFADISGANTTSYTTGSTSYDNDYGDFYRCKMTAAGASDVFSTAARLFVQRTINITSQPVNTTGAVGGTSSFGVAATTSDNDAGDITYQWQVSITNGSSWSDVSEGTGGTTATYTTPTLTTAYDEYQYRCLLSCAGATTTPSNAATLQVETVTVVVSSQPSDAAIDEGQTATFTTLGGVTMAPVGGNAASSSFEVDQFDTPAGGGGGAEGMSSHTPGVTYQWEKTDQGSRRIGVSVGVDTDGGQATGVFYLFGFEQVTVAAYRGATYIFDQTDSSNATYNNQAHPLMLSTGIDGDHNGHGHYSTGVTYKLDGVTVTMAGYVSGFTSATTREVVWEIPSNATGNIYYWCHYHTGQGGTLVTSDSTWSAISGATSASYTTGLTTWNDDNGDRFRCVISAVGAASPATTNEVDLTVYRTFQITAQPSNVTANEGGTANFAVTTSASSGTPTYQWERSDDGGSNYSPVAGATSASYTTPTLVFANDNLDRYRTVVRLFGAQASLTSSHGELTVLRVISIQTQPNSTAVIEGGTATFTVVASITSDTITYQWQKSTNSGANWSDINGANSASYTTPATVFPTTPSEQFRCVLTNTNATTVTSSAATLTVNESEFVSGPATVTPVIDADTNRTFSRQPIINTTPFIVEYAGSTHFSSFWRIRRVVDNVTVYDTTATFVNGDTGNLTSFTVPSATLDFDTAYAIQVKFRDNNGLESAYSAAVNFVTPLVDQPEIQTITPAFNPTINVDAIAMKAGYQHTSSDWQFSPANSFATIVHQSLGNSTNLNSYTLPGAVNLTANTTYYVRIRFNINPT
jgi:plastocyanin